MLAVPFSISNLWRILRCQFNEKIAYKDYCPLNAVVVSYSQFTWTYCRYLGQVPENEPTADSPPKVARFYQSNLNSAEVGIREIERDRFRESVWGVEGHFYVMPVTYYQHGVSLWASETTVLYQVVTEQLEIFRIRQRERALRIAASDSQVTANVVPGGHWLHLEDPDGVRRKLLQHIRV